MARAEPHGKGLGEVFVWMFLSIVVARGIDEIAAPRVHVLDVAVGFRIGPEVVALDIEHLTEIVAPIELVSVGKSMAQLVPD